MDLSTLRRDLEAALASLALAERDARSGLASGLDIPSVFKPFASLTSLESFACARECHDQAPEGERFLYRALLEAVSHVLERSLTASLDAARLEFEAKSEVLVEGEPLPLRQVHFRLANEPVREQRERIARALNGALPQLDATLSRRIETCQEFAGRLGFASYPALRSAVTGVDLAELEKQAAATLASTEDAWHDLVGFGLRRLVGRVSVGPRGDATAHDLVRFGRLEPCDDVLRTRRLRATLESFSQAIGLGERQAERIELTLGSKANGAAVHAFAVPFSIGVDVGRLGGGADYLAAFEAMGRAHHHAGTDPDLAPEHRRRGDLACNHGFGALFARLLADAGFLVRSLDADSRDALETARLVAIERLGALRRQCAALQYQLVLWKEGPQRELRGLYRELHRKAMGVDWPVEPWLWDVSPELSVVWALRGAGFGAALESALREQANEDFWRNPRTGGLLLRVASRGGRDGVEDLAKEQGQQFFLPLAARRLVEVAAK